MKQNKKDKVEKIIGGNDIYSDNYHYLNNNSNLFDNQKDNEKFDSCGIINNITKTKQDMTLLNMHDLDTKLLMKKIIGDKIKLIIFIIILKI